MSTTTLERIDQEIASISDRLHQARARVAQANQRLEEIDARQRQLSASVFSGDEAAQEEFRELEDETQVVLRSRRVASDAAEDFARELEEARERREEAQREAYRTQAREIRDRRKPLEQRADELASELADLLEQQSVLAHEEMQVISEYDQERANLLAGSERHANHRWLNRKFAQWMRS